MICTITIGHTDLTTTPDEARFMLSDFLSANGHVLATFTDGWGIWDTGEAEECEAVDCWICDIPEPNMSGVRIFLQGAASVLGVETLGFAVHSEGPAYLEAAK